MSSSGSPSPPPEAADAQADSRQEARFRAITGLSWDYYWETDADHRFTEIVGNPERMASQDTTSALGHRPWDAVPPEEANADWLRAHRETIARHERFRDLDIAFTSRDGVWHVDRISGEPRHDRDGTFLGYRGTGRDVTEIHLAARTRRSLEAQLLQSQKMESLGVLAGGIAHDFNNLLGGILGNATLAMRAGSMEERARLVAEIERAGRRGRALVQQILTFARRTERTPEPTDLDSLVAETLGLLQASRPAGTRLLAVRSGSPVVALVDPVQMHQVLMNLCTNAWHALPEGVGTVTVGTDRMPPQAHTGAGSAGWVHAWVQDTGVGMAADTAARIFEPFFTTRAVGKGTGLGLSVVHGIVTGHGGVIEVDSTPSVGTTFHLWLPATDAAPAVAAPENAVPSGQGEHVLYVDDDDVMTLVVEQLLVHAGYRATSVRDPARALALVREEPLAFDAVVTDFDMPLCNGLDLARDILASRPGLPVVLASGSMAESLEASAHAAGVHAVLAKERTVEDLARRLAEVFGRA
jgi:PAS domain S-box-containing protein